MYEIVIREYNNYYKSLSVKSLKIEQLGKRELAFLQFTDQIMIRHMAFANADNLKRYLASETPAHVYYSSAYYADPTNENMNNKGWLGADLIFDIDADHIPTECKNEHDMWKCLDCQTEGKGFPPENCPKCSKKRIETKTWVCDSCLKVAKNEIFKLINNFLIPDFGISEDETEICFSGHRGYHLHIVSEKVRTLTNDGRREIADYVRGIGIDMRSQGFRIIPSGPLLGPNIDDAGWRGKIATAIFNYLEHCKLDDFIKIVSSKRVIINDESDRIRILEDLKKSRSWWGRLSTADLKKLTTNALTSIKHTTCYIDERVTIDTKRLIRYPNSLHGKSGLVAKYLSYAELDTFNPLNDAIAFKDGTIKVYVKDIPRIRLGEDEIGPIRDGKEVEVPKAIGIYLLCKGAAEPRS